MSDELFPFRSRFVELAGHRVHHVDEGSGPTLLMLHGIPTWSFVYREVITRLRGQFRCVALDYPGFGLSEAACGYGYLPEEHAQVVSAFLDRLDLTDVTLVAQDWGGPIGMAAVERSPERFSRLVLANTWAWPVNGDLHFELFSRTMGGLVGRELIRRLNLFVHLMVPVGHRHRRPTSAGMARTTATPCRHIGAGTPAPSCRRRSPAAGRSWTASSAAWTPSTTLPALLIWGDADIAFRTRERERWKSVLADTTTVPLHRAGHYVQSDAAEQFAEAIRAWHPDRRLRPQA